MGSIRQFALALLPLPAFLPVAPLTGSDIHQNVVKTIAEFKKRDPGMAKFFSGAAGYAVFPTVGKGAIGIGGARGTGELLVGGKAIGKVTLSQVTVGFQLGGQSYSEVIFFEKESPLHGFKKGDFAFAAEASAVALTSGVSANAAYRNGVAVFTMAKGGLMYEASIGGQKFDYKPY